MATLFATRDEVSSAPVDVPVSLLGLRVDRTDISFENINAAWLRINVRVTNDGPLPVLPSEMQLESAPLGAFLPWQPLLSVPVPLLMPRQSMVISGVASVPRPALLGQPRGVTPAQLLAALTAPAEALQDPETGPTPRDNRARRRRLRQSSPGVAADPFALLGTGGVHWAGNIDVLMRQKAVERHLAQALRVYPGKTNLAMFFVGNRMDGYRFDLEGMADEWEAELLDMTGQASLRPNGAPGLVQGEWIELHGCSMFFLVLRPPQSAERGEVQVRVQRQSDGMEAVVEFSLDTRAAGTGCYTV
jgi:hypothetical protein